MNSFDVSCLRDDLNEMLQGMQRNLLKQRDEAWKADRAYKKVNTMHRLEPLGFEFEDCGDYLRITKSPENSGFYWRGFGSNTLLDGRLLVTEFMIRGTKACVLGIHEFTTTSHLQNQLKNNLTVYNQSGQLEGLDVELVRKIVDTLHEIDIETTELARSMGIPDWLDFSQYSVF